jgi:hypothetical protein
MNKILNKNTFSPIPPMGWNSYDYYDTTVNEAQVKANADYMAAHLKEYGWKYVVVDIQWYANDAGTRRAEYQYIPFGDLEMDDFGRLQPSPKRFPSSKNGLGFKPLADYIHDKGLKFGIHIMRGIPRKAAERHLPIIGTDVTANEVADASSICGWNPDMYGVKDTEAGQAYYDGIIKMYADWGVDFIKCDDICDSWMYRGDNFSGWHETRMLHEAIIKCGREIVLSLSPGPAHIDRAWQYCKYANMWRITDDFWDNWELLKNMFWRCEMWQDHVSEGCYPDCDMLPIGKIGGGFGNGEWDCNFTHEEQKTMMTLWCMFRSPLMVGAELTKLDDWTLSLLTNSDILNMLSNTCKGIQLERTDNHAIWKSYNSADKTVCIGLFNLSDKDDKISISLSEIDEEFDVNKTYDIYELWDKTKSRTTDGKIETNVSAHGVKVYKIINIKQP